MTELSAEERQKLKQQSAQMAITDANLSQYLAGAAAVVALISPPHAAVLGLGAAAMGVCGNYRQAVANDPPRDDFDQVSVSEASFDEAAVPQDDPNVATAFRFAANQILLSDAFLAMLTSLERHDGAVQAGNADAASSQADAVRQNADKAADLEQALSDLGPSMNEAISSLRGGRGFDAVDLDQVKQVYRDAWGDPPAAPGSALQQLLSSISGTAPDLLPPLDDTDAHPILAANDMPEDRGEPFDDTFKNQVADNSSSLRDLTVG